jgi:hypothetical protein
MDRLIKQLSRVVTRGLDASAPAADYVRCEFVDSGFMANDEHRNSWSLEATCSAFSVGLPGKLPSQVMDSAAPKPTRAAHAVVSAKPAWPRAR